jgi:hypothetical protein
MQFLVKMRLADAVRATLRQEGINSSSRTFGPALKPARSGKLKETPSWADRSVHPSDLCSSWMWNRLSRWIDLVESLPLWPLVTAPLRLKPHERSSAHRLWVG